MAVPTLSSLDQRVSRNEATLAALERDVQKLRDWRHSMVNELMPLQAQIRASEKTLLDAITEQFEARVSGDLKDRPMTVRDGILYLSLYAAGITTAIAIGKILHLF